MARSMSTGVMLISIGMFLIAGCAKQDVVRKDETISPAPVTTQNESLKQNATDMDSKRGTTPIQPTADTYKGNQKAAMAAQLQSSLQKIYFDFDSSGLSESARATLTKNADLLNKESSAKISIEGNCDERGSAEYNLALGERRALAAKKYLLTLGVSEGRLATISYGKERPVNQGHDEPAWEKNRRDEFVVVTY